MKTSRLTPRLMLVAAVLASGLLAIRWLQAQDRVRLLKAEIAAAQAESTSAAKIAPVAGIDSASASTDADLPGPSVEEMATLLAEARRNPELVRFEAALRAIRRIQAEHVLHPLPPRPLPPPRAPNIGSEFPQLMEDPEYARLVFELRRTELDRWQRGRLAQTGAPRETQDKVLDLLAESAVATMDARSLTLKNPEARDEIRQAMAALQVENSKEIAELTGQPSSVRSPVNNASSTVSVLANNPLADALTVRLSYSDAPLSKEDAARLSELTTDLLAFPFRTTPTGLTLTRENRDREYAEADLAILELARTCLQPQQLDALRQLQEERQAARARRLLPESSKLPRTVRRDKAEAAAAGGSP